MTDTAAAEPAAPETDESAPAFDWGRALDIAGVAAGLLLVVIVADIFTDGRIISRRLIRRPPQQEGEISDPGN